ncbi:hypothetical protein GDO81_012028 [Engystomops pustulosus]|uniref:AAA ATPase AAA+ lid domain-containing protein n=1 Tax=Engystomops pustulosus TaxID=76066 RepID=A0AAV7BIA9_ENGPU|nr:hypothetical protein GDO81_012028 [Engystomops pustulosus]
MQTPDPSVHLREWQQNVFALKSDTCSPVQKADVYRAHISPIQYAWANSEISQDIGRKKSLGAARSRGLHGKFVPPIAKQDEGYAGLEFAKTTIKEIVVWPMLRPDIFMVLGPPKEFLVQLDGATTSSEDAILVVGATNRPQEIDEAARGDLLEAYIPLPEASARESRLLFNLMSQENCCATEKEVDAIVLQAEGFSGADMTTLCREAALGPIRSLQALIFQPFHLIKSGLLLTRFSKCFQTVRPSVSKKDLELYENGTQNIGCGR